MLRSRCSRYLGRCLRPATPSPLDDCQGLHTKERSSICVMKQMVEIGSTGDAGRLIKDLEAASERVREAAASALHQYFEVRAPLKAACPANMNVLCRLHGVQLLLAQLQIQAAAVTDTLLPHLMPILARRLGRANGSGYVEHSEDIRLLCLQILYIIIQKPSQVRPLTLSCLLPTPVLHNSLRSYTRNYSMQMLEYSQQILAAMRSACDDPRHHINVQAGSASSGTFDTSCAQHLAHSFGTAGVQLCRRHCAAPQHACAALHQQAVGGHVRAPDDASPPEGVLSTQIVAARGGSTGSHGFASPPKVMLPYSTSGEVAACIREARQCTPCHRCG